MAKFGLCASIAYFIVLQLSVFNSFICPTSFSEWLYQCTFQLGILLGPEAFLYEFTTFDLLIFIDRSWQ